MTHERLKTARRFAAAQMWSWLQGMTAVLLCDGKQFASVTLSDGQTPSAHGKSFEALPDLDDPVTCVALLALVRIAMLDPDVYVRPSTNGGYVVCSRTHPGGPTRGEPPRGHTELDALLAALEAAPQ